ncbi:MAG: WbqC family protein [Pseudomonadota bacterium]
MIVTIIQPAYLPWLGYFHRISCADIHVVLDHVQIDKNSKTKFANRNKIRTPQGWSWLTVPIKTKGKSGELELNAIEIDQEASWKEKHWQTIKTCYSKAPFFKQNASFFEEIYSKNWLHLCDLNAAITEYLLQHAFQIVTPSLTSSSMNLTQQKDDLILEICLQLKATQYISGPFGREYLDKDKFNKAGIEVIYHDYNHPTYTQLFQEFEPYMSAIDLLFNTGPDAMSILKKDQILK